MVLGFSRDAYYEIVRSQDIQNWCLCHIHAFEHFGGVPRIVIPDNLKSAIIKAAYCDPLPNRSYAVSKAQQESFGNEKTIDEEESEVSDRTSRKAWARLLTKVYEIDPMVCPKCGSEMRIIAVIRNPPEIRKILKHLKKIGRPPPGVDYSNIAV